ncbi:hypothetical protein CH380_13215 [Leptospira adleri]|uniref:Uncharacterized protein n=1 Tax=Leptospira adleri TaxID=2023186 RepID=A0A2M9YME5_9LEPT|nr:hypothetical protein CH380_13215 [Leptospira adleri]PJZ61731.1 hypothetical protein CH376_11495 [Leptospira adleri]
MRDRLDLRFPFIRIKSKFFSKGGAFQILKRSSASKNRNRGTDRFTVSDRGSQALATGEKIELVFCFTIHYGKS